jgi:hypothetical protein
MRVEALPAANEIDHPPIRQAAQQYEAAKHQVERLQSELKRLDGRAGQTLRAEAEKQDAEAAAAAMIAGKPAPKRRHVAEHDAKPEELGHELRVAQVVANSARSDLQAVLDKEGATWLDALTLDSEKLEQAFDSAAVALTSLYGQRAALNATLRKLGADEVPNIRFVRLKPSALIDSLNGDRLQLAYQPDGAARQRQRVEIHAADVLAALSSLGVVEEPQVVGSGLGDALKLSFGHNETVERGYAPGEHNAPAMGERYLVAGGRRVSVHVPDGGGED